eukprot:Nitzschia sp. Nitz4//scaffold8_size234185//62458//64249//NITZ4_001245-RA/size234185-augustus-gene-0.258-mRNA-1//-1//CDS//3329559770//3093//frame0
MSLLLETTLGDLVIDLDLEGSPELCRNVLKLAKARYYTSTLVYNVQPNRFCQLGDPHGDGSGGACIHALLSTLREHGTLDEKFVLNSHNRFLRSNMGRPLQPEECQHKGRVVATEMQGIPDTIGSQLLITTCEGSDMALDGYQPSHVSTAASAGGGGTSNEESPVFRSVGVVVEDDNNVLEKIGTTYCDATGRPYADIRVIRVLVIDDPFEDPPGMDKLLQARGVLVQSSNPVPSTQDEPDWEDLVTASPSYERPPEETVEIRISADQVDALPGEEDPELLRQQQEELLKREDKSRAVVLEMLGDLPDADITAPENVLFVCKLNPVTEDEDLELIFSRFDENVKAEIIRDHETGNSLQYAFVEFTKKEQAVEAYFKMNNALVDDRRIKVDFSQSVAKGTIPDMIPVPGEVRAPTSIEMSPSDTTRTGIDQNGTTQLTAAPTTTGSTTTTVTDREGEITKVSLSVMTGDADMTTTTMPVAAFLTIGERSDVENTEVNLDGKGNTTGAIAMTVFAQGMIPIGVIDPQKGNTNGGTGTVTMMTRI